MKKLISLALVVLMLAGMLTVPAMAAADEVSVYLFGEKLEFDVPAQIVNGRTLVPVRKIFESLGYTVDWDKETRTAIAVREDMTIRITENSYTMYVNDEAKTLDVPACIIDGRTLVPARAISESSGYEVDWDPATRSVLITKPGETENALDKEILATIGDYEISRALYNCNYYICCAPYLQYEQYYGENWINEDFGYGMTFGEMIELDTKAQIEFLAISSVLAEKNYGITAEDVKDQVDADMKGTVESYLSKAEFEQFLEEIDTTEKAIETYFEMYSIFNLLMEKTATDGKVVSVSDAEVKKIFDQQYGNKMKVQHILVATESLAGYAPSRTDAEAKSIASDILKKLEKGEDFGKLIELYNEDPGMTSGNYYVFGEGEMVLEFETASKNLTPGKYTKQAVKSAYGYHIIKRYPLDYTSEEYKELKLQMVQEKLIPVIEDEVEKTNTRWNN